MTTTAWAHLSNAVHIDRVIASTKAHPDRWKQALYTIRCRWQDAARVVVEDAAITAALDLLRDQGQVAVWYKVRNAGWDAVRDTARDEAQNMGFGAARDVVWDGVWEAGYTVLLALCAFDDCAYMLDSEPSDISMLAMLGDHRAILLLAACNAFHSISSNYRLT